MKQMKIKEYIDLLRERHGEKDCNWTLGGLFRIHNIEIIDDSGNAHPRFDIA